MPLLDTGAGPTAAIRIVFNERGRSSAGLQVAKAIGFVGAVNPNLSEAQVRAAIKGLLDSGELERVAVGIYRATAKLPQEA